MKSLLLVSATLLSSSAFANSFDSIRCGDHWWSVTAETDFDLMTANVTFDGEGVQDDQVYKATIRDEGDLVIELTGRDEALIVDMSDAVHDIYWGSYRSGEHTTGLGLCTVE